MFAQLIRFDEELFRTINHLPHNIILDTFFLFISGVGTYGLIWLVIMGALFLWEEIKDKQSYYALITAMILEYFFVEIVIKNVIQRPRPFLNLDGIIEVGNISRSFSFFSGHATMAFAAAFILSYHHPRGRGFYYLLASLIAFSRIYLGKHYPLDVFAGIIIGQMLGFFCIKSVRSLMGRPERIK